jgi:hypothetical protein
VTAEGKRQCENWEKRPQRLEPHYRAGAAMAQLKSCLLEVQAPSRRF